LEEGRGRLFRFCEAASPVKQKLALISSVVVSGSS
jgi:hypothetical protein